MSRYRRMIVISIGILIFIAGTMIGRAQQKPPDFVITTATAEQTGILTASCVRGCQLQWSKPISPERFATGLSNTVTFPCPTGCKETLNGVVVRQEKRAN